jgi:PAS domain S-box-containing protein
MQSNLYEFQKRQIALMARVTPYAMAGHIANTTVIVVALAGSVRPAPLIIWCAYSYATALLLLYRHMKNRGRWPRTIQRAAKKATIYSILLALPWSSLAVLYLGSLSHGEELILVALGIGMAACGTVLLSAIPPAAFSYMTVILLPSALKYLLVGQQGFLLLGTLALSYWGCLAALVAKTRRDIRDRQEAELALTERNAQIALAGTAALVGSFGYDVNNGKMQVSEGYVAIHGLPEGTTETTRREWRDRLHPEDVECLDRLRSQAFGERRREYNVEYRILLRGRGVRWIESRSFISYDGDGNAQRVIGVNIDVTDRKRTEVALQASEAKFAGILAIAGDAIISIDTNHEITLFNEAAERVYGYSHAEMLGRPIDLLIPKRYQVEHHRLIEHFGSGPDGAHRAGERQEVVGLRKTGEEFPAEASISKLDVGGERYYTVVMRDISDRKRAEFALAERNAQLALAERAVLVGSYSYDVDKCTMQISEGYAAIHGLSEGTTETSYSAWRTRVHPQDLGRAEELRDQAFADRRKEDSAEYRIVRSTGEVRWIERRDSISYGDDGRPQRVVGVNIDVTERKRAEQHQCALNAELDHRVKNVLATVSAIIGQTQEASRSPDDFVAGINRRIKSLAGTHELLSRSNWHGVPLAEIIRRELLPYGTANTHIGGPGVTLKAEATQAAATVFHELTTNAAKYGAFSNRTGRVSVQWQWLKNGLHDKLVIEWQEFGGPPVLLPSQSGYGTSIIRDLIPFELGGTVELVFAAKGIRCRLEIPAGWISEDRPITGELEALGSAQAVSSN